MKKTIKMLTLVIIMIMVALTLTGCANTEDNNLDGLAVYTAEENMEDYTKCEAMAGVEFYYPSDYVSVGTSSQPMYMDPEILGANISVVEDDFSSAMTFEGYVDASILGIKAQMTISGDLNKEYINLNGIKAAKLDYTAISSGQTMSATQIIIKKDTKVFILTGVSLDSDAEAFAPKLEKMVKSFK